MSADAASGAGFLLDDRIRGFPTGHEPIPSNAVAGRGWRPQDGRMAPPMLTLDLAAFAANARAMLRNVSQAGALIAPHAKTPMSVGLAQRLVEAGAWGATVADARQAAVLLEGGVDRLILANQTGGAAGARRLAGLLRHHPSAEIHVFVDAPEAAGTLSAAWAAEAASGAAMPTLGLLVEVGTDRAGLRDAGEARALIDEIAALPAHGGVGLAGVATYEGASGTPDPEESLRKVDALLHMTADLLDHARERLGPAAPLIATAGGSIWFDRVLDILGPRSGRGPTRLILRSGAIFFSDHGVYARSGQALAARGGLPADPFVPAMRLWAEVLSRPEPDLAILGLGLRDAAVDQGLPVPLRLWRDGAAVEGAAALRIDRFNDQHAFARVEPAGPEPRVGDVLEAGISHPCTNFDRHGVIWGLGPGMEVQEVLPTAFG